MSLTISALTVGHFITENCYLAADEQLHRAAVIDPGAEAGRIMEAVDRLGCAVEAILLTHGHGDHIGAVEELRAQTGAPVYAPEAEKRLLEDPAENLSAEICGRAISLQADRYVRDGDDISAAGARFRVICTPGHTSGSVCFYEEKEGILFSGDTLFAGSYGRTDFPTGSMRQMIHSVVDVLLKLPPEVCVYPGHMDPTTIGDERKYNMLAAMYGRR